MTQRLLVFPESSFSLKCIASALDLWPDLPLHFTDLRSDTVLAALEDALPFGRVPALILADTVIVESATIVEFLAVEAKRHEQLYHYGHAARAIRFAERVCDSYLSAPLGRLFHQQEGWEPHNTATATAARTQIGQALAWARTSLSETRHIASTQYSAADYAWATALQMLTEQPWWAGDETVAKYLRQCTEHTWFAGLAHATARSRATPWAPTLP